MKIIKSDKMPIAGGHYSMCVEHNGLLYISGQLPFEPENRTFPAGIELQTKQVLKNIELILLESGTSKNNVLQVRIYLAEINDWKIVNEIYADFFGDHKPARCIVGAALHYGALLEVELTASQ